MGDVVATVTGEGFGVVAGSFPLGAALTLTARATSVKAAVLKRIFSGINLLSYLDLLQVLRRSDSLARPVRLGWEIEGFLYSLSIR